MWKQAIFYLPEWTVFMQGFIAFFIPYMLSRFFKWLYTSKEENEMADIEDETKLES
ncbi:hypothetical protein [Paenibacillus sp. NPDC057967]|uniref:hypothetical protein n=1 Tax=Paenibacillus sp. NPDC057967 TaxID=3346293 RepID=UPI0036DE35A8